MPDYRNVPSQQRHSSGHADRRTKIWIAVLSSPVIAALVTGLLAWAPWQHGGGPGQPTTSATVQPAASNVPPGEQSVYVNPTSGAGGTQVTLSGDGFPANGRVVFRFHTDQFAETRANDAGKFSNVTARIPTSYRQFAPEQFSISATSGAFAAQTAYQLTG